MTPTTRSLLVLAPAKLVTLNAERSGHWSQRANTTSLWRYAAKVDAMNDHLPAFKTLRIKAAIHQAKGRLADAGSHFPVVKACIDGLVDAKVISDDTPDIVVSLEQLGAIRGDRDAVVLYLEGEVA